MQHPAFNHESPTESRLGDQKPCLGAPSPLLLEAPGHPPLRSPGQTMDRTSVAPALCFLIGCSVSKEWKIFLSALTPTPNFPAPFLLSNVTRAEVQSHSLFFSPIPLHKT